MEAVRYGLVSMEREMLANVVYALPESGSMRDAHTIGDAMTDIIANGKLEHLSSLALEDKRDKKVVDVEVTIVE